MVDCFYARGWGKFYFHLSAACLMGSHIITCPLRTVADRQSMLFRWMAAPSWSWLFLKSWKGQTWSVSGLQTPNKLQGLKLYWQSKIFMKGSASHIHIVARKMSQVLSWRYQEKILTWRRLCFLITVKTNSAGSHNFHRLLGAMAPIGHFISSRHCYLKMRKMKQEEKTSPFL